MLGLRYDHFYDGYCTFFPHIHICFECFEGAFEEFYDKMV
jgi:hypothetical protein